jgi:hypothetical protein
LRIRVPYKIGLVGGPSPADSQFLNPRSPIAHALRGTLTQSDISRVYQHANAKTRHLALIKPGRKLGGAWLDHFISQKRSVSLCRDCEAKYASGVKRMNYERRDLTELTDCDGCGTELSTCHSYFYSLCAS